MLTSRPRPTSSALDQTMAAVSAASFAPRRSPAANRSRACIQGDLRRLAPQAEDLERAGFGRAGRGGCVVALDRLELGDRFLPGRREPIGELEAVSRVVGGRQARPTQPPPRSRRAARGSPSRRRGASWRSRTARPAARRGRAPAASQSAASLDDLVVACAGGPPILEQRQVVVADDPRRPEVVVAHRCRAPRADPADRASRAGRRPFPAPRCHGRPVADRLGGWYAPIPTGSVGPDLLQHARVRPDRAISSARFERRRIGVVLGRRRLAPDRTPGVERDLAGLDQLRASSSSSAAADAERLRDLQPVVRGERLVGPAVREQSAVEPGMGGLVEDHEVLGVVGDLDQPLRRVEQPGIATGRAARGLLDQETAITRPTRARSRAPAPAGRV